MDLVNEREIAREIKKNLINLPDRLITLGLFSGLQKSLTQRSIG